MTLESDIARYSQLQEATAQSSQGLTETQSQAQGTLNAIRDRIKAGESTGNKIRDYVILNVGFDEELEQHLHTLEEDLKSHEGQFVLVVSRSWRLTSNHSPRVHNFIETTMDMGIVSPPFIQLETGSISMQGHVSTDQLEDTIRYNFSDITPFYRGIYGINKPLGEKPGDKTHLGLHEDEAEKMPSLEVYIGDEAVTNRFINEASFTFMPQYTREFISRHPEHELSQKYRDNHYAPWVLVKYYKMQRVLGRQIDPEIPGYEQIEEEADKRKMAVLESLLSEGENYKRSRAHFLYEAGQLGMAADPMIIEIPVRPGVKTVVDVPMLVLGYIEENSKTSKNSQP